MTRLLYTAAVFLALAAPALAETIDNAHEYRQCMALARSNPEEGWENALAWSSLGGGEAARHCGAVALIGLKKYEEAAGRLEVLAQDSHREPELRAQMLAQAGQAWFLAGRSERAKGAQTAALKLTPNDVDLLIDRATSFAELGDYASARADLDQALTLAPRRADALTFRAAAWRYADNLPKAEADIAQALGLEPNNPDALLERGMLARLKGDDAAARQDWARVLQLAPDSAAAEAARTNIAKLEIKG